MNTERIGSAAVTLGAGRVTKTDEIDYTAGIKIMRKTGDYVTQGEILATLHSNNEDTLASAEKIYREALTHSDEAIAMSPLIYKIVR